LIQEGTWNLNFPSSGCNRVKVSDGKNGSTELAEVGPRRRNDEGDYKRLKGKRQKEKVRSKE